MKKSARLFMGLLVSAIMLAGVVASPAMAQDKAKEAKAAPAAKAEKGTPLRKVLVDNAKVMAYEVTYRPGDENTAIVSTTSRVVRALTGGTTQWTFADGKKETKVRKAGDFRDSRVGAVLQQFPPAERPGNLLDHGVLNVPVTVVRAVSAVGRMRPLRLWMREGCALPYCALPRTPS